MIVNVKELTSAVQRISDIIGMDNSKEVPSIMFDVHDDMLALCFAVNDRAYIDKISAQIEDGEAGRYAVAFDALSRVVANAQGSGSICVRDCEMEFNNVINVTVKQWLKMRGEDGEDSFKERSSKRMECSYKVLGEDVGTREKVLIRMNYNDIFDAPEADTWNRKELIHILNILSSESGKVVYLSSKLQRAYVVNTATVISLPVSPCTITSKNEFGEDVEEQVPRIKTGITLVSNVAKGIASILSRMPDSVEDVYMHVKSEYVAIFTPEENIGIWVNKAKASRNHVSGFEMYSSLKYDRYQMTFSKDFLLDSIKSAINSSSSDKTTFKFQTSESGEKEMVIASINSLASINDIYRVSMESLVDSTGDIEQKGIPMPLKIFYGMLNNIRTDVVAMDIDTSSSSAVMRVSEIDMEKMHEAWEKTRERLNLNDNEPTPVEDMMACRQSAFVDSYYAMLGNID